MNLSQRDIIFVTRRQREEETRQLNEARRRRLFLRAIAWHLVFILSTLAFIIVFLRYVTR
jgi:hypothetical protein